MEKKIYKHLLNHQGLDEISLCAEFLISYGEVNSILSSLNEDGRVEKRNGKLVAIKKEKQRASSLSTRSEGSLERESSGVNLAERFSGSLAGIRRAEKTVDAEDILKCCGAILPESIKKKLADKKGAMPAKFIVDAIMSRHGEDESGFEKEIFDAFLSYLKENPNNTNYVETFSTQKCHLIFKVGLGNIELNIIFDHVERTVSVLGESIKCLIAQGTT